MSQSPSLSLLLMLCVIRVICGRTSCVRETANGAASITQPSDLNASPAPLYLLDFNMGEIILPPIRLTQRQNGRSVTVRQLRATLYYELLRSHSRRFPIVWAVFTRRYSPSTQHWRHALRLRGASASAIPSRPSFRTALPPRSSRKSTVEKIAAP